MRRSSRPTRKPSSAVFETEAEYRDPYVRELIDKSSLFGRPFASADTIDLELTSPAPSPPDRVHWLGTDGQGRDVIARRFTASGSVLFGLTLTVLASAVGVAGAVQGYMGGRVISSSAFYRIWSGLPIFMF